MVYASQWFVPPWGIKYIMPDPQILVFSAPYSEWVIDVAKDLTFKVDSRGKLVNGTELISKLKTAEQTLHNSGVSGITENEEYSSRLFYYRLDLLLLRFNNLFHDNDTEITLASFYEIYLSLVQSENTSYSTLKELLELRKLTKSLLNGGQLSVKALLDNSRESLISLDFNTAILNKE